MLAELLPLAFLLGKTVNALVEGDLVDKVVGVWLAAELFQTDIGLALATLVVLLVALLVELRHRLFLPSFVESLEKIALLTRFGQVFIDWVLSVLHRFFGQLALNLLRANVAV